MSPVTRLLDGRLKLRHLVIVDALTEHGSLSAASKSLHITQPVVTRALKELEGILGVPLYERGPRGVVPTEFGRVFTVHARAVLAELGRATRHLEELADATRGHVTVGTHLAGTNLLLLRAIARLKRTRPQLTIVVREARPATLRADAANGDLDLALLRLPQHTPPSLTALALHDERVRFITRRDHPLTGLADVSLDDVRRWPWTVPGPETAMREEVEAFLRVHRRSLPADRVETTSFLTVRRLVLEADFVAVLPELVIADDDRFVSLPIPLDAVGDAVGLVHAAEGPISPATQAMIETLTSIAVELEDPRRQHDG